MNFKLKNIEDYKGEVNIYIFQINIILSLNKS